MARRRDRSQQAAEMGLYCFPFPSPYTVFQLCLGRLCSHELPSCPTPIQAIQTLFHAIKHHSCGLQHSYYISSDSINLKKKKIEGKHLHSNTNVLGPQGHQMGDEDQALRSMDIASLCHLALGSGSSSWLCLLSGKYRAGDARRRHKAYFSAEISKRHNSCSALQITWEQ